MDVPARKLMMALLVLAFVVQTWLVYADGSGRQTPPLSELAERGQRIWLDHNCQSCHQIYGFGGFLGPDLTNAIRSLTDARLDLILTEGAGLMPAFALGADDRSALKQFFVELDRTGVGQVRYREPPKTSELLDHLVELVTARGDALTDAQAAGLVVVRREKCIACHLPNHGSPTRAPDLSTAVGRLGAEKLAAVLVEGVPGTVMPRFDMPAAERTAVIEFLAWMESHPEKVASAFKSTHAEGGSPWALPWFEYE